MAYRRNMFEIVTDKNKIPRSHYKCHIYNSDRNVHHERAKIMSNALSRTTDASFVG